MARFCEHRPARALKRKTPSSHDPRHAPSRPDTQVPIVLTLADSDVASDDKPPPFYVRSGSLDSFFFCSRNHLRPPSLSLIPSPRTGTHPQQVNAPRLACLPSLVEAALNFYRVRTGKEGTACGVERFFASRGLFALNLGPPGGNDHGRSHSFTHAQTPSTKAGLPPAGRGRALVRLRRRPAQKVSISFCVCACGGRLPFFFLFSSRCTKPHVRSPLNHLKNFPKKINSKPRPHRRPARPG